MRWKGRTCHTTKTHVQEGVVAKWVRRCEWGGMRKKGCVREGKQQQQKTTNRRVTTWRQRGLIKRFRGSAHPCPSSLTTDCGTPAVTTAWHVTREVKGVGTKRERETRFSEQHKDRHRNKSEKKNEYEPSAGTIVAYN